MTLTYPWAPDVDAVAQLLPAYTRGSFDDQNGGIYPGSEQGEFTDSTSPTEEEVEGLIQTACEEIAGRVGIAIPLAQYGLATATAKWHVAMTISGDKMAAGTEEAAGQYRQYNSNFVASLNSLVELARMPAPTTLA